MFYMVDFTYGGWISGVLSFFSLEEIGSGGPLCMLLFD
jgi:hypothetical protein